MRNFKSTIWNKRVPQFFGAIVLFFSFITIIWLSQNAILLGTKAAAGKMPQNVQISNITESSFTVSYLTDDPVLGTLSYGADATLGTIALDDQDQVAGKPFPHRAHHITLLKLNPSTRYYLSILSDDQTFTNNNVPYEVVTGFSTLLNPSGQPPLTGKLILDSGNPPTESLVFISSDTSQLLSALVKPDGTYLLPINALRKKDLSAAAMLSPNTVMHMVAAAPQAQSIVTLFANQTNPVPLITLSKDYNFSLGNLPLTQNTNASSSGKASSSADIVEVLPVEPDTTIVTEPKIITPSQEEKFKDNKPLFTGKALPDKNIEIIIESEKVITASIKSDAYGNWSFRPALPLAPGAHTITIKSLDASGILKTITQSFTVYAQGSKFTEPSVSQVPQPTQTVTPSPTTPPLSPTMQVPMATPPVISLPPAPPPLVTAPLPSLTQTPIPPAGNSSAVMAVLIASISIGIGAILFFLTKGASL